MKITYANSKMPGKPWIGTTNPMCVLHTLEFEGWPNPDKWDSPSHYVFNPRTQELRQYVSPEKAAYSLRKNALEDDYFTLQVELWGKASLVPGYDDEWYEGVAALVDYVSTKYNIPLYFADFSVMNSGEYATQRMSDAWNNEFTGFLGHGHFGRGVDAHWDPGRLDIDRVKQFLHEPTSTEKEGDMPTLELYAGYKSKGLYYQRHAVKALQIMLASHGFADKRTTDRTCGADGLFGPGTLAALIAFQKSRGLVANGTANSDTFVALSK